MTATPELFRIEGRVALVTGGARHLGHDMATALAEAGADVIVTSRDLEQARAAALGLAQTHGVRALGLALDQRDFASVQAMAATALAWTGRVDILVNNAGGTPGKGPRPLFERDPDEIRALIELNLTGLIYCCREIGRAMAEQGRGKIINIASIAGMVGRDRRLYERHAMGGQPVDYAAAKAGVIGLTRDLAGYLSPKGVHVNAISPGGFNRNLPEGFVHDYSAATPLGRMGIDGLDLKGAVLFLASAASDYITGQNLVVDGGFTGWK